MKTCLQCKKEISDKAKYCSDKCRMAFTRTFKIVQPEQNAEQNEPEQPKQPEQSQPEQSQPEQKVSVPAYTQPGLCHACGRKFVSKENFMDIKTQVVGSPNTCICFECWNGGMTHEKLGLPLCRS